MDKRRIGVVLALIAAVVLGFGTLSRSWWESTSDDARIGLHTAEMCVEGRCNEMSVSKLVSGDMKYARSSAAAYWGGLLACLLLLVTGVAGLRTAGNSGRVARVTLVAVAVAGAGAVGAVVWFPRMGGLAAGFGSVVFFIGIALGVGACGYEMHRLRD